MARGRDEAQAKRTRWRYRLWFVLSGVWSLMLLQSFFPPHGHASYAPLALLFYAVVQAALLAAGWVSWRDR